jgi:hypothetical protein
MASDEMGFMAGTSYILPYLAPSFDQLFPPSIFLGPNFNNVPDTSILEDAFDRGSKRQDDEALPSGSRGYGVK